MPPYFFKIILNHRQFVIQNIRFSLTGEGREADGKGENKASTDVECQVPTIIVCKITM